jgi:ABC-2 type transport system permease protein
MYNFWIQTITYYRGLNDWYKGPPYFANFILFPVVQILTWAILGRFAISPDAAKFFAIGQMVSQASYSVLCASTMSYANDRWYSMLGLFYITPANRLVNFIARILLLYHIAIVSEIVCLVMIRLTTPVDFGLVNWPLLIISLLIINLSILAFAQFLSIFSIIFREWLNTLAFALGFILILTGIVMPLSIFPVWIQEIGKLMPITNGLVALRAAFDGQAFGAYVFDLLREVLTAIVYFFMGYFGFVFFEKVAKRKGIVDMEDYS